MAVTHEDLLRLWPADQVVRWTPADLAGLGFPADAVRVLCEVGLPRHIDHYDVWADRPGVFTPAAGGGPHGRIGHDMGGAISVELATGIVWQGADEDGAPTWYVNTTLAAFVESMIAATGLRRTYRDDSAAETERVFAALTEAIREIDPDALDAEDSYWEVILEQMETGLF